MRTKLKVGDKVKLKGTKSGGDRSFSGWAVRKGEIVTISSIDIDGTLYFKELDGCGAFTRKDVVLVTKIKHKQSPVRRTKKGRKLYSMNCILCNLRSKSTDKESARRLDWVCRKCMKSLIKNKIKILRIIK